MGATISSLEALSPTVRGVTLQLDKPPNAAALSFLPGQWIDLFLPGVAQAGGFSICSAPELLVARQQLQLASQEQELNEVVEKEVGWPVP